MIQVSYDALKKRYDQGWVLEIIDDLDRLMERIKEARQRQEVSCLNNWLGTRRKNHKIAF
jgi:urocanate hydratase